MQIDELAVAVSDPCDRFIKIRMTDEIGKHHNNI